MADAVGPAGGAYGVDIAPALVQGLEAWADQAGTDQFVAVLGTPDDERLLRARRCAPQCLRWARDRSTFECARPRSFFLNIGE